ncbi:MAG TPA: signal peptidase I [Erysipelothrix sp.]|nr:signal peptidase I [Erysipelothrix sp.]
MNRTKRRISLLESVLIFLVLLSSCVMLFLIFFTQSIVISGSMENTIMTNTRIISKKYPKEIKRNDIVAFYYEDEDIPYLKRVIGIPGDEIILKDGLVYINGERESFEPFGFTYAYYNGEPSKLEHEYNVPNASYFVLGDNREHSFDSREFENVYILKGEIIGKAVLKVSDDTGILWEKLK